MSMNAGWRPDRDPAMRAGDEDREAVAKRLQDAHAEGRLTVEELHERLDRTYTARTLGELAPIIRDLPAVTPRRRPEPRESRAPGRGWQHTAVRGAWMVWAAAVSINLVIWVLVSVTNMELIYFWPIWVAGPWGVVLVFATIAARGTGRDR